MYNLIRVVSVRVNAAEGATDGIHLINCYAYYKYDNKKLTCVKLLFCFIFVSFNHNSWNYSIIRHFSDFLFNYHGFSFVIINKKLLKSMNKFVRLLAPSVVEK